MKILHCYICNEDKNCSEFYEDRSHSNGYASRCKKCNNTYKRRKKVLETYRTTHKNEIRARDAVKKALKKGLISKLPCGVCGESKVHAHHHAGYEKENWLVVSWLCLNHHYKMHYE